MSRSPRSVDLPARVAGIALIVCIWSLALYLVATASVLLTIGAERAHAAIGDTTYNTLFATAGVLQAVCVGWILGAVGMLALGAASAITATRSARRIAGTALFGTGVLLLLAHPLTNTLVFGHLARERLQSEFDRVQRLQLTGCTPDRVEALLGSPDSIVTTNGRTNWHYSPGPWYAWQLDDITVTFESGVVSSIWIDYF